MARLTTLLPNIGTSGAVKVLDTIRDIAAQRLAAVSVPATGDRYIDGKHDTGTIDADRSIGVAHPNPFSPQGATRERMATNLPPVFLRDEAGVKLEDDTVFPILNGEETVAAMQHLFETAEKSIFIGTSTLRESELIDTLEWKAREGVEIRIVVADPARQFKGKNRASSAYRSFRRLEAAGVKIRHYPSARLKRSTHYSHPEYHRKLIVVDGKRASILSSNVNPHPENFDMGLVVEGPSVPAILKILHGDWYASGGEIITVNNVKEENAGIKIINSWALNDDIYTTVTKLINEANESIVLAFHLAAHPDILNALIKKRRTSQHIKIVLLGGPPFIKLSAFGATVPVPRNIPFVIKLQRAGIDVKWANLPNGGILHAKTAVFDGKTVFLGSADMTRRGFHGNLETNALLVSDELAGIYESAILFHIDAGTVPSENSQVYVLFDSLWMAVESGLITFNRSLRPWKHVVGLIRFAPYRRILAGLCRGSISRKGSDVGLPRVTVHEADRYFRAEAHKAGLSARALPTAKSEGDNRASNHSVALFGGYYARKAQQVIDNPHMLYTNNGKFGKGVYLSTEPRSAINYGLLRSLQNEFHHHEAHVILFAVDGDNFFNLRRDEAEYERWRRTRYPGTLHAEKYRGLSEFCAENGYIGVFLENEEGPGCHYVVAYNVDRLRIGGHYKVHEGNAANNTIKIYHIDDDGILQSIIEAGEKAIEHGETPVVLCDIDDFLITSKLRRARAAAATAYDSLRTFGARAGNQAFKSTLTDMRRRYRRHLLGRYIAESNVDVNIARIRMLSELHDRGFKVIFATSRRRAYDMDSADRSRTEMTLRRIGAWRIGDELLLNPAAEDDFDDPSKADMIVNHLASATQIPDPKIVAAFDDTDRHLLDYMEDDRLTDDIILVGVD